MPKQFETPPRSKQFGMPAILYGIWSVTFVLAELGSILFFQYISVVPLGAKLVVGNLLYLLVLFYAMTAVGSIPCFFVYRKQSLKKAATPAIIVIATLMVYALYLVVLAPQIHGGGALYHSGKLLLSFMK